VSDKPRILFLCTGNACRSQMAEAILRDRAGDRIEALSAGSHPAGYIHPLAVKTMQAMGIPMEGHRSKSWQEFRQEPPDIVITVCEQAADEVCPHWPDVPVLAHWPLPDPVGYPGPEPERLAFCRRIAERLCAMIDRLLALPIEQNPSDLAQRIQQIAQP